MSKKLILVIVFVGVAILGFFYVKLGGLNEPVLALADSPVFFITGKYYQGHYNDQAIEDIFYEVRQQLREGKLKGVLTIIYYKDPMEAEGKVAHFIGIASPQKPNAIPDGFEQRKVAAGKVVRATIHAHNVVMPTPEAIKEELAAFAGAQGLELQDISIEKYYSERQLVVEVPVK